MSPQDNPALACSELSRWLATGLGDEKARAVVLEARQHLRIPAEVLSIEQVHSLLDHLAEDSGLVGMTAMLAKSRLHFLKAARSLEPN
jgi:hypothetical protein